MNFHTGMPRWQKNTAHICANEDIVVNLDCDNLVGPQFVEDVVQNFVDGYTVVHYHDSDGTCGRIVCKRKQFHELRGYDEDAYPMGAQDSDLLLRLRALPGVSFRRRSLPFSGAIPNDRTLKASCVDPTNRLRWGQMDALKKADSNTGVRMVS